MEEQDYLPLEMEFTLKSFELEIEAIDDLEVAKDLCYFLRRQLMMREMIYRTMLKRQWFSD
jgi:hypothetical protein